MIDPAYENLTSDGPADAGETGRDRLAGLTPRRRLTGEQAAARSRMVRRLRVALPIVALALVAFFLASAGDDGQRNIDLSDLEEDGIDASAEELRMANPRFSGVDADGAPYDITADTATQARSDEKLINLERPKAVTVGDAKSSTLTARAGAYRSDENTLVLRDDVTYARQAGEDGYVLRTSEATFTVDEERVVSDRPVSGEGPRGSTLRADSLQADNQSGRVVLEGNVRMRIYPKTEKDAEKDVDAANAPDACAAAPTDGGPALRDGCATSAEGDANG